jgi:hypothetical protein
MAVQIVTETFTWDDIDMSTDGTKTPATESAVIELDGQRVALDLTTEHRAELGEVMAKWLAAGTPVTVSQPAVRRAASTNGGNGNGINGPEHAELRAAIRDWADAQGRTDEYRVARADGHGFTLIYPRKLRDDFDAAMAAKAAATPAPEPETSAEPEVKAPVTPITRRRPAK